MFSSGATYKVGAVYKRLYTLVGRHAYSTQGELNFREPGISPYDVEPEHIISLVELQGFVLKILPSFQEMESNGMFTLLEGNFFESLPAERKDLSVREVVLGDLAYLKSLRGLPSREVVNMLRLVRSRGFIFLKGTVRTPRADGARLTLSHLIDSYFETGEQQKMDEFMRLYLEFIDSMKTYTRESKVFPTTRAFQQTKDYSLTLEESLQEIDELYDKIKAEELVKFAFGSQSQEGGLK